MARLIIVLSVLLLLTLKSFALLDPEYYGSRSTEGIVKFDYFVESESKLSEGEAKLLIDKQLSYLFGSMANNEFKSVPKTNHQVKVFESKKIGNVYRISYQYQGTAVVMEGAPRNFYFPLPRNPESIYA